VGVGAGCQYIMIVWWICEPAYLPSWTHATEATIYHEFGVFVDDENGELWVFCLPDRHDASGVVPGTAFSTDQKASCARAMIVSRMSRGIGQAHSTIPVCQR